MTMVAHVFAERFKQSNMYNVASPVGEVLDLKHKQVVHKHEQSGYNERGGR
jgi:hypothetical protein